MLGRRTIFGEEHDDFRRAVRTFLEREAQPRAPQWESDGIIDREFWRTAAANGLVGFAAPVEYGGLGSTDFRFNVVLDEEVVRAGIGTDAFSLTNNVMIPYLLDLTTDEQRQRWLPGLTSGELVAAVAMSEPGAGSDLRGIRTTARRDGDHYRISGQKTFITSGIQADLVVVVARVEGGDGLGLFVVPADAAGFARGRKLDKIGRRAQDTAELFFDEVRVGPEDVLGEPGNGLALLKRNLPQERLGIAVIAQADAEWMVEFTLTYARERTAFGRPIGSFQANRFALADLVTDIRVGRTYIDRCIELHADGQLSGAEAAGAKYWATDLEWRVADRCLQLHGGYGYMEEYEIARRWRDARVQRIYGGSNEIMRDIVGRSLGL
ncbi:MAG: acyl-CoA dehydrogenase [Actinomycetota bacterium]|nr:MAG: acyl-CoA dehydrogenase [Actinomycetota bacterium]